MIGVEMRLRLERRKRRGKVKGRRISFLRVHRVELFGQCSARIERELRICLGFVTHARTLTLN
jgi:hypothetical protein